MDPLSNSNAEPQHATGNFANDTQTLSILPLRWQLAYPLAPLPLRVSEPNLVRLVEDALVNRQPVGTVATRTGNDNPTPGELYTVGTMVNIERHIRMPDGTLNLLVEGVERFRIVEIVTETPYFVAQVQILPEVWEESSEVEVLQRELREVFGKIAELRGDIHEELQGLIMATQSSRRLTYLLATYMRMGMEDAQRILEMNGAAEKMRLLLSILNRELSLLQLSRQIQSEVQGEIEKTQREHFLREQLKVIRRELGELSDEATEVEELRAKIEAAGMNPEAHREALRELDRLSKIPTISPEYSVIRTYLDWLVAMPWKTATKDNLSLSHARAVLDEDHYGLTDAKERILEFLAVRKRRQELSRGRRKGESDKLPSSRPDREGAILCFVGPPGVGKTSLGASIARAMGRKFVRMSVGGIRDESDIRGFRRTYIGAVPGRIVQSLRRVGTRNPVFVIDEVDKIGLDYRGDPASALLEVLDPEQNREFRDHYLDVPFDLSQTLFICTANTLDTIPGPLRDRMEVLHISGYTEQEKLEIARRHLLPRQIRENGLLANEVTFTEAALLRLIREYTREAGVRNLEREIGRICRKLLVRAQEGKVTFPILVTDALVRELLGKPRYDNELAERTELPGVAIGLSWTPMGGEVMFVEATRMPGRGKFLLTGQLGDVMKESAQAAHSYIRSRAEQIGIDPSTFKASDLHVHVPAGAQPKDGPSAGVTIATALASLLTERRVRPDVAMTGEITLRGSVLPVGGIKEKVLAAHRAGIKTVVLPRRNAPDLEDLPEEVRRAVEFELVDRVDQVLAIALAPSETQKRRRTRAKPTAESRSLGAGMC
ncbi:MAG: endopeptidase La [Anaerolineae bacterium]|nr:endopeptidase La [Anaerolineae bacterium]